MVGAEVMRAEILGLGAAFEVQPENGKPPVEATLTLRLCWRKPPVQVRVAYVYTNEITQVAYYAEKTWRAT
jgi:hypothetical protein